MRTWVAPVSSARRSRCFWRSVQQIVGRDAAGQGGLDLRVQAGDGAGGVVHLVEHAVQLARRCRCGRPPAAPAVRLKAKPRSRPAATRAARRPGSPGFCDGQPHGRVEVAQRRGQAAGRVRDPARSPSAGRSACGRGSGLRRQRAGICRSRNWSRAWVTVSRVDAAADLTRGPASRRAGWPPARPAGGRSPGVLAFCRLWLAVAVAPWWAARLRALLVRMASRSAMATAVRLAVVMRGGRGGGAPPVVGGGARPPWAFRARTQERQGPGAPGAVGVVLIAKLGGALVHHRQRRLQAGGRPGASARQAGDGHLVASPACGPARAARRPSRRCRRSTSAFSCSRRAAAANSSSCASRDMDAFISSASEMAWDSASLDLLRLTARAFDLFQRSSLHHRPQSGVDLGGRQQLLGQLAGVGLVGPAANLRPRAARGGRPGCLPSASVAALSSSATWRPSMVTRSSGAFGVPRRQRGPSLRDRRHGRSP